MQQQVRKIFHAELTSFKLDKHYEDSKTYFGRTPKNDYVNSLENHHSNAKDVQRKLLNTN